LVIDLPDAGQVGTLDDARQSFFDAEAVPQAGFWLEMIGAIALTVSGAALATMSPDQLGALSPVAAGREAGGGTPVERLPGASNGPAADRPITNEPVRGAGHERLPRVRSRRSP
jgi:hypothetical protein